ncbi:MAG: hypothetical protein IPL27_14800 [Lewinellaceae bacterium]|nr:hypothetical protein [Lewinellaceae bacterium]
MAYKVSDLPVDPASDGMIKCGTHDAWNPQEDVSHAEQVAVAERGAAPVQLKVYRLAIAAQGEYSIFNGGTKPLVLSAIVESCEFYCRHLFTRFRGSFPIGCQQ